MPALPPHPTLRPGLAVAVRDDRHLQVGVDPPRRLLLPALPEVRRLLEDLTHRRVPRVAGPAASRALELLAEHDLLVDATGLAADLARGPSRPEVAAAYAAAGDDAARRLRARRALRVAVEAATPVRADLVRWIRESGSRPVGDGAAADVCLIVLDQAPAAASADRWLRSGLPHLVVGGGAEVVLGPFVVPGVTACLRCVEAHRALDDPRRPVVTSQLAGRPGPLPVDSALLAAACAWAVRDLACYAEGDRPTTWSATVSLSPGALPRRRAWPRHPHCGCAWDELRTA